MEETIGYEALFSPEEWDSMNFGDWGEDPEPDSPTTHLDYSKHTSRVFDPPGQNLGDEERFDVECDLCGWIAAADTSEEAEAIVTLHENLVATLTETWTVER